MQAATRIWLEISHHRTFRIGGWAFVRLETGQLSGTAGGERQIDAERIGLAGLAAALRNLSAGASIELLTSSPTLLAIPRRLTAAEAAEDPPTDNLDLWSQIATALARVAVVARHSERAPGSPTAFAAAWADLARDRAKDKGAFESQIPKPNLAKVGL